MALLWKCCWSHFVSDVLPSLSTPQFSERQRASPGMSLVIQVSRPAPPCAPPCRSGLHLRSLLHTGDAGLHDNSAADPRFLSKKGGPLDLCFGTKWNPGNLQENNPDRPGDCHLLIARVNGKTTAAACASTRGPIGRRLIPKKAPRQILVVGL